MKQLKYVNIFENDEVMSGFDPNDPLGRFTNFITNTYNTLQEKEEWTTLSFGPFDDTFVFEGGPYEDLRYDPALIRIQNIKQLGFLSSIPQFIGATSNRYMHSLLTAIVGEYVTHENGLGDYTDLAIFYGLLHDLATPPFSEQGKLACPEYLDEEDNFELSLNKNIRRTIQKYGLSVSDVAECIRGTHPVLGKLANSQNGLDIDRISHVIKDFRMTYHDQAPSRELVGFHGERGQEEINEYINPGVFSLYKDISFEQIDGRVWPVFEDSEKLGDFLMVRALMHRDVYFSWLQRARERMLEVELRKLWEYGKLDKQKMLEWTDDNLRLFLRKEMNRWRFNECFNPLSYKLMEEDRVWDRDANQVREDLRASGKVLCDRATEDEPDEMYIVSEPRSFNTASRSLVKTRDGAVPFERACPKRAKALEDVRDSCGFVGIYRYIRDFEMTNSIRGSTFHLVGGFSTG